MQPSMCVILEYCFTLPVLEHHTNGFFTVSSVSCFFGNLDTVLWVAEVHFITRVSHWESQHITSVLFCVWYYEQALLCRLLMCPVQLSRTLRAELLATGCARAPLSACGRWEAAAPQHPTSSCSSASPTFLHCLSFLRFWAWYSFSNPFTFHLSVWVGFLFLNGNKLS